MYSWTHRVLVYVFDLRRLKHSDKVGKRTCSASSLQRTIEKGQEAPIFPYETIENKFSMLEEPYHQPLPPQKKEGCLFHGFSHVFPWNPITQGSSESLPALEEPEAPREARRAGHLGFLLLFLFLFSLFFFLSFFFGFFFLSFFFFNFLWFFF